MIIYWRVCEAEKTQSFVERWNNYTKAEVLRKCWLSVQNGITDSDSIIVVHDKCTDRLLQWLEKTSQTSNITFEDGTIDEEHPYFTRLASIIDKHTKQNLEEIHYLCNDDFLHTNQAIDTLKSVFQEGWKGFAIGYDYPDRYRLDRASTAEIYLGSRSHWRSVPCCTGCTTARGAVWQDIMTIFKEAARYNTDSYTWMAYGKHGCVNPIPGVTTHLTQYHMTPRVNWQQVWDSIEVIE
tara:strand:+ start:3613 stop:4326 length:714 start_codon:yes stop_codon:yes gene_type:complete